MEGLSEGEGEVAGRSVGIVASGLWTGLDWTGLGWAGLGGHRIYLMTG